MVNTRFIQKSQVVLLGCLIAFSGCATVKVANMETGRITIEDDEKRLMNRANEAVEELDGSAMRYDDPQLEVYLSDLVNKLIPAQAKVNDLSIKVLIINEPTLNAFALPNGRIYVHTGILASAENEAQVAALLAHEVTHILHRHSLKELRTLKSNAAFWQIFSLPISVATGGFGGIIGSLSMVSSISGYSREMETEADNNGFELIKAYGYDVKEGKRMFELLDQYMKDEKEKEPFFFSSHPHIKERIDNYSRLIALVGKDNVGSVSNNAIGYQQLFKDLVVHNIELCLTKGLFKTAEHNIDKFINNNPQDKRGYFYQGELFRQRQDIEKKEKERVKKDDYIKAVNAYDKAIALDQQYPEAVRGKAKVLYAMGDKLKAKENFRRYLEINPEASDRAYIKKLID